MYANDSSFWRFKVYADIRGDSLGRCVKRQCGWSRERQFPALSLAIFPDTLEMKPALLLFSDLKMHDLE